MRITVEIESTDALLALGALDARAASGYREARRLMESGQSDVPEYDIAFVAATACDRVSKAISDVLYPPKALPMLGWDPAEQ